MSLQKPIRKRNRLWIEFLKELLWCMACGRKEIDLDHITTVGAGGGDIAENLFSFCREHHTERHTKGWLYMAKTYPGVKSYLKTIGRNEVLERANERTMK